VSSLDISGNMTVKLPHGLHAFPSEMAVVHSLLDQSME
jgi:hypothetical protein